MLGPVGRPTGSPRHPAPSAECCWQRWCRKQNMTRYVVSLSVSEQQEKAREKAAENTITGQQVRHQPAHWSRSGTALTTRRGSQGMFSYASSRRQTWQALSTDRQHIWPVRAQTVLAGRKNAPRWQAERCRSGQPVIIEAPAVKDSGPARDPAVSRQARKEGQVCTATA